MTPAPEIRLSDSDVVRGGERLAPQRRDELVAANLYMPEKARAMISLGRPIVWVIVWPIAILVAAVFSAWKAYDAVSPVGEFVDWMIAFAFTIGAILLGMSCGLISSAPLLLRRHWFFGVGVFVGFLACSVFLLPLVEPVSVRQSASVSGKKKMIFSAMNALDFRHHSNGASQ